ncbi:MAG: DNA polymerase III subunit epsilon [Pseudomonadota bacterium]
MRQIVLDTETTGLEPETGHRIIEIGAVEMVNRRLTGRHFHKYINPEREIDDGAYEIHGISAEFLADKPRFAEIENEFLQFVDGAELVIHNAPFDVSFLNFELAMTPAKVRLESICEITDSLAVARQKHPGQKNNLDALCRRYAVDNSQRELHGALLDAEILADVYLLMTGGQTNLFGGGDSTAAAGEILDDADWAALDSVEILVVHADAAELVAHEAVLDAMQQDGAAPIWRQPA